jgi:hypothetical protein
VRRRGWNGLRAEGGAGSVVTANLFKRYGPLVAGIYLAIITILRSLGQIEAATVLEEQQEEVLGALTGLLAAGTLLLGAVRKVRKLWVKDSKPHD